MKVFTSIFVLDGLNSSFDDIELSLQADQPDGDRIGVTDGIRRRIVELHAQTGQASDRPESGRA